METAARRSFFALPLSSVLASALLGAAAPAVTAQEPFRSRCGTGVHLGDRPGWNWLPQGDLFCPLVADPKAERSFLSYLRGDFGPLAGIDPSTDTNIGSVGLGDSFAIFRIGGSTAGNGVQLDLSGAVFSQFNLDEASFDMINADYLVGLPLTLRHDGFSSRLRIYHQSSHLGDEFLLNREPERVNLSFESIELILSQEVGLARLYVGGEKFFAREPEDLPARLAHAGAELRPLVTQHARVFTAVDLKAVDGEEWTAAWSVRAGIELAHIPDPGHPPEVITLFAEYYDGAAPYGQFYRDDIRYWGFGFSLYR
jgi:hypothetical protein